MGEFTREYGDCELGPKCPNYPKYVNYGTRKYKNRFLLNLNMGYPIRDLQNAINKCLFEKECVHTNWGSSTTHIGTRAVKCDLNISSLPWILGAGVKKGERCLRISDIDFELQLMNVKFTLSAIILGRWKITFCWHICRREPRKTHFLWWNGKNKNEYS